MDVPRPRRGGLTATHPAHGWLARGYGEAPCPAGFEAFGGDQTLPHPARPSAPRPPSGRRFTEIATRAARPVRVGVELRSHGRRGLRPPASTRRYLMRRARRLRGRGAAVDLRGSRHGLRDRRPVCMGGQWVRASCVGRSVAREKPRLAPQAQFVPCLGCVLVNPPGFPSFKVL